MCVPLHSLCAIHGTLGQGSLMGEQRAWDHGTCKASGKTCTIHIEDKTRRMGEARYGYVLIPTCYTPEFNLLFI